MIVAQDNRLSWQDPATETSLEAGFSEVVAAARAGEPDALSQLFRTYQPRLLRYLRAQERVVADDLAADVWLAVAGGLDRFEGGEANFRSWIFTIARFRLIEHRRRRARRRTDPLPTEHLDRVLDQAWDRDPAWLVTEQLGAQEAVSALMADLTEEQAEVVLLRVLGGFDVAEVARIMDRSPGSVRVLCHRALKRLAGRMSEGALAE
ncbi:MAG TPA: RNA polymerase sigma factor [Acidimicrobiales bacterium]|nr:RNA polymerase sigma factor [Acidimicrobiales bacterium]